MMLHHRSSLQSSPWTRPRQEGDACSVYRRSKSWRCRAEPVPGRVTVSSEQQEAAAASKPLYEPASSQYGPQAGTTAPGPRGASPAHDAHPDPAQVCYATFRWPAQLGGEDIRVSGSWDGWSSQTSLLPAAADGTAVRSRRGDAVRTLLLPRGVHDYKFVVDGRWRPAPADPVARDAAGATNNKRLMTAAGLITLKGRRDVEVLVMGDWSGWTDAQRMLWNERTQQWECPLALPPGEYSYVLHYGGRARLHPDTESGPADVAGRARAASRLVVEPPPAFALFYATGWPRCSLVYRIVSPQPQQQLQSGASPAAAAAANGGNGSPLASAVGGACMSGHSGEQQQQQQPFAAGAAPAAVTSEWREIPLDGAPSRAGPTGGRWMTAVIEAPGPDAALQFYVRGPKPDVNDEWGQSRGRGGGGGGGSVDGYSGGSSSTGSSGVAEDRPSSSSSSNGNGSNGSGSSSNSSSTYNGSGTSSSSSSSADGGPYYTLPWPGGWKLERGQVTKFLRALQGPILLCSDVDGTFVSDRGGDAFGDARVADFRAYWEDVAALGGSVLVLNTGRSKGHLMELLRDKEPIIAVPDVLITAVGTKIWHRRATHRAFGGCTPDDYEEDAAWAARLDHEWDIEAARAVASRIMADVNGGGGANNGGEGPRASWLDRGTEHPHRIALSVRVDAVAAVAGALEAELGRSSAGRHGVRGHVIASGAGDWRYVDVVAARGGKLEAIEWVREMYGVPSERTMTAGDSLNDVEMFRGRSPGVIVGNAQAELLAWFHRYREAPPGRIVAARAPDAAGVLEGLARHGLL